MNCVALDSILYAVSKQYFFAYLYLSIDINVIKVLLNLN